MNILVDQHHSALLYALQSLFELRLGHKLYVPRGRAWADEGYWQFGWSYGDDRLVRQYLMQTEEEVEPGLTLSFDSGYPDYPIYGVTVERARTMDWGAVMATVQDNQLGFARLASQLGARYLYHVGNTRQDIDFSLGPLVLNAGDGGRGIRIGEEMHPRFRWYQPVRHDRVVSFMNLLPLIPESVAGYAGLAKRTGWTFRSFGHACPDGFLTPMARIADEMARAGWGYHDKPTGDGWGHVVMGWAAVGRPLIGHASYYAGQRAEPLWQDGTCIDLDRHDLDEAAAILREMTPERHADMCCAIREAYESIADPAGDALRVAEALAAVPV